MVTLLANGYVRLLTVHPWKTVTLSTGLLAGVGDISSQQIVEKRGLKKHDVRRTIKMCSIGMIIGPCLQKWFTILDKFIVGTTPLHIAKKVAFDQTVWAPIGIATMFILSDKLDYKSNEEIKEHIRNDYLRVLKVNYCLWPGVQLMNFYFTPFQYRVLVVNCVALFWNTFLSWMLNSKNKRLNAT